MNAKPGNTSLSLTHTPLGKSMTAFLLLTTLAVIVINGWSLWDAWQHRLKEKEDDARNLSVSLARQAEDTFLQVDISLGEVVRHLRQNGLEYAATPAFTRQLQEQQAKLTQLHSLSVFDADGNRVATSGRYIPAKFSNADREYFIWHRTHTDANVHISHVIYSRSTADLFIPVTVRLDDSAGNFAGIVLAAVKVDYFKHFYSYYTLGERDELGLILTDTSILYMRPFPDTFIDRRLTASPLFKTPQKASNSGNDTWRSSLDGVNRIFGHARFGRYPLIVLVGYDRDRLRSEWLSANLTAVVLNLVLLAVIIGMGLIVLRQVRTSVRNQLELTQTKDELTTINRTLQSLALVDGLTGLANRRHFDALLDQGLERSRKSGEPISLIMMDIDFFKHYNDTYGHVAGDMCLKKVGGLLSNVTHRHTDLVARYGGEEFAIILPFTNAADAKKIADGAVRAIREAGMVHGATALPNKVVTISAGCCTIIADGHEGEATQFRERADAMLYEAKHRGRNRAMAAG
ncbi:diguanylate cyclase [Chimaeribacter californicus]